MFKSMSIALRISVAVVVLIALTVAVLLPVVLDRMSTTIRAAEQRELQGLYKTFTLQADEASRQAVAMARLVAEIPPVQDAFAARDRDTLVAWFGPGFKTLKDKSSVGQFQFHLAPATSFVRIHKLEKFGDDLSGFRHTVVESNTTGKEIIGLEKGVAGLGARGVVPMMKDGRQTGTVEFGLRFDATFVQSFANTFGVDVSVLVPQDDGGFKVLSSTRDGGPMLPAKDLPGTLKAPVYQPVTDTLSAFAGPLADYSGKPAAVVEIILDTTAYADQMADTRLMLVGLGALVLLVGLILAIIVGRSLSKPVVAMTGAMHSLAKGDLRTAIPARDRADEIGRMAAALEVFKTQAAENQDLRAHEEEAKRHAEAERKATLESLAREFEETLGSVVNGLAATATELRATAEGMASNAEETSRQADAVRSAADDANRNVDTVASAAEELAASVQEISRQVDDSARISGDAVAEANRTNELVKGLDSAASEIGEVVSLITDIAEQTNLLALNATIEAARAGDAGKGFAVVANEVKTLAHQTEQATSRISGQVKDVQEATRQAVTAIHTIHETISRINEIATAIASAVEEQSSATNNIAQNVHAAADGTQEVSANIGGVSEAAGETGQASHNVLDTAEQLSKQSETLRGVVATFLEHVRAA